MKNENFNNLIKSITPLGCPHCEKVLFISSAFVPPSVSIFSEEMMNKAKETVSAEIKASTKLSDDEKNSLLESLMDEGTVFGPEDVEQIIKNNISEN